VEDSRVKEEELTSITTLFSKYRPQANTTQSEYNITNKTKKQISRKRMKTKKVTMRMKMRVDLVVVMVGRRGEVM
jgi:hypothetical protein